MNTKISTAAHRAIISTFAAIVLAAALPQAGFAQTTADVGIWTVNLAKSKFGASASTLVIEPGSAKTTQGADAKGNPGTFLVISDGKIYLATDAAAAASGLKNVDYSHWSDMKLVQIGEKVRSSASCEFRCQSGLVDTRGITLTFTGNGIDPSGKMGNVVVLNAR
jgi:hypothetical protein